MSLVLNFLPTQNIKDVTLNVSVIQKEKKRIAVVQSEDEHDRGRSYGDWMIISGHADNRSSQTRHWVTLFFRLNQVLN